MPWLRQRLRMVAQAIARPGSNNQVFQLRCPGISQQDSCPAGHSSCSHCDLASAILAAPYRGGSCQRNFRDLIVVHYGVPSLRATESQIEIQLSFLPRTASPGRLPSSSATQHKCPSKCRVPSRSGRSWRRAANVRFRPTGDVHIFWRHQTSSDRRMMQVACFRPCDDGYNDLMPMTIVEFKDSSALTCEANARAWRFRPVSNRGSGGSAGVEVAPSQGAAPVPGSTVTLLLNMMLLGTWTTLPPSACRTV